MSDRTFSKIMVQVVALTVAVFTLRFLLENPEIFPKTSLRTVPETVDVHVYDDLRNEISEIDWGTLAVGETAYRTIYIVNRDNIAYILSLATANWNPTEAQNYISLTWNATGQTVNPQSEICALLTLHVSENCTGITTFTFDIIIYFNRKEG